MANAGGRPTAPLMLESEEREYFGAAGLSSALIVCGAVRFAGRASSSSHASYRPISNPETGGAAVGEPAPASLFASRALPRIPRIIVNVSIPVY